MYIPTQLQLNAVYKCGNKKPSPQKWRLKINARTHTHIHTHLYTYIKHTCICPRSSYSHPGACRTWKSNYF